MSDGKTDEHSQPLAAPLCSACFWPGCKEPAFCVSGNVDALVCRTHFAEINADTDQGFLMFIHRMLEKRYGFETTEPLLQRLRRAIDATADLKQRLKKTEERLDQWIASRD